MTPSPLVIPANGIARAISILAEPGQVVELRALADTAIHSGYFNDYAACARFAEVLDCDPSVHGCYVTLNVVNPALLARRANRIKMHISRSETTTSDADIIRRRWLPIDIDPVRPGGVSSTDAEHELARAKAEDIAGWLSQFGFPEPVTGDSGNGAHLLYRIDLPNNEPSTKLVKSVLGTLDLLFSDTTVSVDTANYNAGRIWKLYGTVAKKGDHIPERPHRRSRIISVPDQLDVVSAELLEKLDTVLPASGSSPSESPVETKGYKNAVNLSVWLRAHSISVNVEKPYQNGRIYLLEACPFSSAHKDGAYAIQFAGGAIHAGCHHASCGGGKQRWKELREMFETNEEKQKCRDERLIAGKREWARAKVAAEGAGTGKSLAGVRSVVSFLETPAGAEKRLNGVRPEVSFFETPAREKPHDFFRDLWKDPNPVRPDRDRESSTVFAPTGTVNNKNPARPDELREGSPVYAPTGSVNNKNPARPDELREGSPVYAPTGSVNKENPACPDGYREGSPVYAPTGTVNKENPARPDGYREGSPVYASTGTVNKENPAQHNADPETPPEYATTDAGNAERLIAAYGDRARYCAAFNAWYLWNGNVWVRDDAGKMLLIATDVARSIHREAAVASTADRSRALSRWAIISESLHARKAMIDSAAPHCPVLPCEFDARPELFNCRNGTLELATMSFREHRKEEMLTKKAAVDYDAKAQCPRWLAHLNLIFGSDTDYLSGFQSMCGYTLLGTNPQQIMFILYGRGRNGKSKTIEVLARLFADYAVNIAADSLMAKRFENARSDLARLAGARLATAAEGAEGARMDEAIIKQITGEYVITVRKLYENEFEFTPVAKIWMTTNHEPVIPGTDDGIWRRIWMVPFSVQIPEEKCDPDIAAKLLAESSGILNWCLAGLSRYYANGNRLVQPRKVSQATANLRTVSDTVGLFLATECAFEVGAKIPRTTFREILEKWFDEEGIKYPPHSRKVANILKEHGVTDGGRSNGERYWAGIRWKNANERAILEQAGSFQDVLSGV